MGIKNGEDIKEIGWLCDAYKAEKLADSVALDTLERELTDFYGLPRKGGIWSRQRQNFIDYLGCGHGDNKQSLHALTWCSM